MKARQPGQTRYWPEAFTTYKHNVRHDRHNLNTCQHKWRELRPKLDRFKAYYETVPSGDLSHDGPNSIISRLTTKLFRAAI
ncbi:hypothetical protein Hanom_Chr17g01529161 [Helianthus anomalus]